MATASLGLATSADAAFIYVRNNNTAFGSNAVTVSAFDDASITAATTGSTWNNPVGAGSNLDVRDPAGTPKMYALIAAKNLFTVLPKTSGTDSIVIDSAKLHLYANSSFAGDANSTITVQRITSDWLLTTAGSNQSAVSGRWRQTTTPFSTGTEWATSGQGFTSADVTTSGQAALTPWVGTSNQLNSITITSIVADMYTTNTNYGVAISSGSVGNLQFRATEQGNTATTPVFEIQYHYAPVPEPTGTVILGLAGLPLLTRRRRT